MANNSGFSFLAGVTLGALVGAAVGVLLAPQSGEETRKVLVVKSKEVADATKEAAVKVKDKVTAEVDKLAQKVNCAQCCAEEELEDAIEDLEDCVEVVDAAEAVVE